MLPVSGAEQLNASGAKGERPINSAKGAYSLLVRPAPNALSGRNRFHKPASRAFSLISSNRTGVCQRSPARAGAANNSASFG